MNLLAQLDDALGSLDAVDRIVRVLGFVACAPDFVEIPAVIDGASELLAELFGPHARSAIGVASLPLGFAVEIELIAAVRADVAAPTGRGTSG